MGSKVVAFVAMVGAAAGGAAPTEAQIGDVARRAAGELYRDGRYDRDCGDRDRDGWHRWDDRGWRTGDCADGSARGWVRGGDDRRDDRWDGRRDDRIEYRYRGDRPHRLLLERLDRLHDDWHRRHGWSVRDRRRARGHDELHHRIERIHAEWHRHDRRERNRGW